MAPYAVGSRSLVNHDSYYGRLSGVFPNCLSAPETSEGLWNSWHFYFEWRSKDYVICRQKCNYQLNGNGNVICRCSVGLLLLSVLLFNSEYISSSISTPLTAFFFILPFTVSFSSFCLRQQKLSCLECWSCSTAMSYALIPSCPSLRSLGP